MQLYSQRDPSYDRKLLGKSNRTIHSDGCFLVSIATLYQRHPSDLLDTPGAFDGNGNLFSNVLARECGGSASASTNKPPSGWSIAVTDFYATEGFATHFFLVNVDIGMQVDPLDFPAKIEPMDPRYKIKQFRPFTNTKLGLAIVQPPIFTDVPADHPNAAAIKLCKERGIFKGYADGSFKPDAALRRSEMAEIAARLLQA